MLLQQFLSYSGKYTLLGHCAFVVSGLPLINLILSAEALTTKEYFLFSLIGHCAFVVSGLPLIILILSAEALTTKE